MKRCILVVAVWSLWALASGAESPGFRVGFAKRDITPPAPMPMWGYGHRHAQLSQGVLDPLMVKAVVIEAGGERLAIVGWDIGRGPTPWMMKQIRANVAQKAGVGHVLISGSHTHHGPAIELTDRDGFGKGTYDDAVAYSKQLPVLVTQAIVDAAGSLRPAKIGVASESLALNHDRSVSRSIGTIDPQLAVIRFDSLDGTPLAVIVNFAAHPVTVPAALYRFSADYPGALQARVESKLGANCVFMQGAAGDLSPNRGSLDTMAFGEVVGDYVVELAGSIKTEVPKAPSIEATVDRFHFASRIDFSNPVVVWAFERAFFPELVHNLVEEFHNGIDPELTTVLLNGDLALVGGSGEFFSSYSNSLKQRANVPHLLFFGYCNGHHMYFPTIQATREGGYGTDIEVSPVQVGAGEIMMDRALVNLAAMLGRLRPDRPSQPATISPDLSLQTVRAQHSRRGGQHDR